MIRNSFLLVTIIIYGFNPVQAATINDNAAQLLYKEECASCHMAYPAWLLPARSWQKIMNNLEMHFGDDASLDRATMNTLSEYLAKNSADNTNSHRTHKILRYLPQDNIPIRISDLPYFRHEHDEIPRRFVENNPGVKSISNCSSCHRQAEQGSFNEHQISIPGYGRWDD